MKFNKYLFLFLLFFLIEFRGFYLVSWPNLLGGAASNKLGVAFYSLILFLAYFIYNKGKLKLGIFGNYILIFFLILFFNSLVSMYLFDSRLRKYCGMFFLIQFYSFIFLFARYLRQKETISFLLKSVR